MPFPMSCRLLPALLCFLPFAAMATVYKCGDGHSAIYSDQPCNGGQALMITPAPAGSPPPRPAAPRMHADDARAAQRLRQERQRKTTRENTRTQKCAKLDLRRQWAQQDVEAARALPLRPQDKHLENARRKARRMEEQYRLECGPGSTD